MTLTVGSLFSGIGGLDLGLERAGMQIKWQVELDPYCNRVLAKHWPDVPRFGDVREVGAHNLPPVDLLCGGFPCQDVSLAGKRAGLDGERSGLWSEFSRLIRVLRPRYALIENVPGLFTAGFGTVLGDLAALGFDAEWLCLRASDFGAPHKRERVFIVAIRRDGMDDTLRRRHGEQDAEVRAGWDSALDAGGPVADSAGLGWREGRAEPGIRERRPHTGESGVPFPPGPRDAEGWRAYLQEYPTLEPSFCRGADGLPHRLERNRVKRLKALGNTVVPQVAEWLGRRILAVDAL